MLFSLWFLQWTAIIFCKTFIIWSFLPNTNWTTAFPGLSLHQCSIFFISALLVTKGRTVEVWEPPISCVRHVALQTQNSAQMLRFFPLLRTSNSPLPDPPPCLQPTWRINRHSLGTVRTANFSTPPPPPIPRKTVVLSGLIPCLDVYIFGVLCGFSRRCHVFVPGIYQLQ
jgi:hypothetical protein